jgi:hypothetical protein
VCDNHAKPAHPVDRRANLSPRAGQQPGRPFLFEDDAMNDFPRTQIENLSVSRMIIGTNWFLGYSHTSQARDNMIKELMTPQRIADCLEVFLKAGVDTIMSIRPNATLEHAIRLAEDRTGRGIISISTPMFDTGQSPQAMDENRRILDANAAGGIQIVMPHQATTDAMLDRKTRSLPGMEVLCRLIRERGMIPGLSTHMPETPIYVDESGLDVATYIQIYNSAGFLMQIEVDWVHRSIHQAGRPVMTIKPMAAGRVTPLVGLAFAWSTIRPIDMVCVGTFSPDEAREDIDISLSILENRPSSVELQTTRSKRSVTRS